MKLFSVHEAVLSNGLKVRLIPNTSVPTAALYTFFRVGSRNERPGITGISHLFEHMFFNGAKKYGPKAFDRVLESSGGHSNAYTTHDQTVYYETFAIEALETVFDLESDRMRSLRISPASLKSEREVVKEERRLRVDNEIAGLMEEELEALVFKAHPYRWPVIGWMADIENISKEDCDAYFETYYAPNNATVYLAGDFEPKQALQLIRKYYGTIPRGPPAPPVLNPEPEQKGERRAEIHHPAQAPSLMAAYRGPAATSEDTLILDVIQFALAVGEGSRLVRELVHRQEVAVHIGVDWSWRIDPGLVILYLELKPDSNSSNAEGALNQELDRLVSEGLPERELEKAKNNLRAHLWREMVSNQGRAASVGTYEFYLGSWKDSTTLAERYGAITVDQVRTVARKYFSTKQRSVVSLIPE